ncbi:sensor histidine kinase [Salsipaludibacter albus]|uniref:sensor histidine kinase n=1 Tax=Salsipaludibacter albus TaxID=2849650 RepID=UPI001EE4E8B5|nr:sensor histidine kinase [Salsipaludibacter albus]MBY5163838.1 sensor histidine kinase [Salsipaludibacter albus]
MSTLHELVHEHVTLPDAAVDHLQAVVSDWQILADLSFADLLMFALDDADQFVVLAQMRPYTAPTMHHEDLVGSVWGPDERPRVAEAFRSGRIQRMVRGAVPTAFTDDPPEVDGQGDVPPTAPPRSRGHVEVDRMATDDADAPDGTSGDPDPRHDEVPVAYRNDAIPIWFDGAVVAVVTRQINPATTRSVSALERAYLGTADELADMLAVGAFPYPGESHERELAPRVGDGMLRLDPDGHVAYASPNAVSAYRRLGVVGNVIGQNVGDFDMDDVAVLRALGDGDALESEVEARGAVVLRRLLPLTRDHEVLGGLMLVREVTELRRHERLLLYKDATIREIHHRVKNNLQTVASLLRLQGRRLSSPEAVEALAESVRRISSIALVHETLSQDARQRVSFDKVASRLADMLTTGLTDPERPVQVVIDGLAGELGPDVATPLALVLSELLQNAVEHAFPDRGGEVLVRLDRRPARLVMEVVDDGVGMPEGWDLRRDANLGLQISLTLVESELAGTLTLHSDGPGTRCVVDLPLPG